MKKALFVILLMATVFQAASCSNEKPAEQEKKDNEIPKRIISLSPSITETLFALGLNEEIVGVTDYCTYPPEAKTKEKVGGLYNQNIEKILTLEPDLVFFNPSMEAGTGEFLDNIGIKTIIVQAQTLEDIEKSFILIGAEVGREEKAKELSGKFHNEMESVKKEFSDRPLLRTMVVVGRNPGTMQGIYVAGKNTFFTELLEKVGAKNIFDDAKMLYPQPSLEEIMLRNPEVIIETRIQENLSAEEIESTKNDWSILGNIEAVANQRIYVLTERYVSIPGPRLILLLNDLKEIFEEIE